ncbi:MAG: hypothetical protein ABEH83_04005 [Halobacterium sp.]
MNRTKYEAPVSVEAPATILVEYGREGGRVVYFVVLLYYYARGVPAEGEPEPVVGFDHDERGERTPHNVRTEGLHMDVYRGGEKYYVKTDFPPVYSAEDALSTAIRHTKTNAPSLVSRFERWHDV